MSKYSEKFKDPRWQKKRLKVLERDDWACQICLDDEATLHIHHRYYNKNTDPWDYPMDALVTLCEMCHEEETEMRSTIEQTLLKVLRERFFSSDVLDIAAGFNFMKPQHAPEVVSSVYGWALQNDEAQKILIEMYFEYIKKHKWKNG